MNGPYRKLAVVEDNDGYHVYATGEPETFSEHVGSISFDETIGFRLTHVDGILFENHVYVETVDYTDEHGYREAVISTDEVTELVI